MKWQNLYWEKFWWCTQIIFPTPMSWSFYVLIVELGDINAIISLENVTNNRFNIPFGSFRISMPSHFILFYENSWSSQLHMRIPYMWRHKVTNKSISFYFFNFSFSRFVTLVSKDIIYLSIMSDNWYLSSLSNYNADVTPWRPAFESQIIIVWLSTDFFTRVWWVWQNTRGYEHSTYR